MGEDQKKRSSLIIKLKVPGSGSNKGGFQKENSHLQGTPEKIQLVPSSSAEEKTIENYSSDAATGFTFHRIQQKYFPSAHGISSDAAKSLPQWPKTAKRGGKILSVSSYSSLTSNEKAEKPLLDEKEAVDALMHLGMLSDKYSLDLAKKNQPKRRKFEDSNCVDDTGQALKKISADVFQNNKKQTPILSSYGTFRCDICEKSFSCYQALGGHKSSCKSNCLKTDVGESSLKGSMRNTHNFSKEFTSPSTHQCKIWNKTFLTGQALGGHKRLHGPCEPKIVSTEQSLNPTTLTSPVQGLKTT